MTLYAEEDTRINSNVGNAVSLAMENENVNKFKMKLYAHLT